MTAHTDLVPVTMPHLLCVGFPMKLPPRKEGAGQNIDMVALINKRFPKVAPCICEWEGYEVMCLGQCCFGLLRKLFIMLSPHVRNGFYHAGCWLVGWGGG